MQTRKITVDYARPRGYDVGYRAENNFTLLALPVPEELEGADSYRVYFESTVGEYLQTEVLTPADGYVTVKITSDIVPEPGNMAAQLVAFRAGEIVGYAPMITGTAKVSIPDGTERLSHSLAAEIALNTAARHSHENKAVLDKFAESKDGKPTYDGEALGSGGSTGTEFLVVNVQFQSQPGAGYTVTSHDKTYAQIDEAYKAGKQVLAVCTDRTDQYLLPLTIRFEDSYEFILFDGNSGLIMDSNKQDSWTIDFLNVDASAVGFSSTLETFPSDINKVSSALDWLIQKAHEHSNKSVLDGLSDSNGVLRYNGNLITTQKISEGSVITLSDNTEYRLTNVSTLTPTYPAGNFECWMRLTFAESGNITVTLPAETKYIGTAPDFKNGETWELSFKDKVLAAQKVGEGT